MRAKPDSNNTANTNSILSHVQQYISSTHNINRSNMQTLASLIWTNASERHRHPIEEYYSSRNKICELEIVE